MEQPTQMKRHITSFLRSPIGYIANFIASATCYLPHWANRLLFDWWICSLCEIFCLKDGVQDDAMF